MRCFYAYKGTPHTVGVPVYPNYVYLSKIASQSYLIRLYDSECI